MSNPGPFQRAEYVVLALLAFLGAALAFLELTR